MVDGSHGDQLTALNVQGLTVLQELNCAGNQLTALDVQGCTAVQRLWCWSNQLTADAFKKAASFDERKPVKTSRVLCTVLNR